MEVASSDVAALLRQGCRRAWVHEVLSGPQGPHKLAILRRFWGILIGHGFRPDHITIIAKEPLAEEGLLRLAANAQRLLDQGHSRLSLCLLTRVAAKCRTARDVQNIFTAMEKNFEQAKRAGAQLEAQFWSANQIKRELK